MYMQARSGIKRYLHSLRYCCFMNYENGHFSTDKASVLLSERYHPSSLEHLRGVTAGAGGFFIYECTMAQPV